ncbi:MAG: HD domain-containing protein [Rubripirellula sp.]
MLPEVNALHRTGSLVRIPPDDDVPISDRVRRVLDSPPMRRLATISQLGMVGLVYPGATHSRLEHSLGVYHNALRLLARFSDDSQLESIVDTRMAEAFVLAALVHDIGHWPFCHPIEDMRLSNLGEHETRIGDWLGHQELTSCIEDDWQCDVNDVVELLHPSSEHDSVAQRFLASCLSGPIDVDKLDYLQRDSLHAGVPYGRNFDVGRLISCMRLNSETSRLAIDEKGRTAAEMMVFSRYVMFSEVYWHHAVRSSTAMLQRSVFLLQNRFDLQSTLRMNDAHWIATLRRAAEGSVAEPLVEGLFGARRRLYKRTAEYNVVDGNEVHRRLARKPYWWLVACAERLATQLAGRTGIAIHAADILIDAPPSKLEVDINVDVISRDGTVRTLGDVSPVASALANQQFDNQVKRVRVFVRDDLREVLRSKLTVQDWSVELIDASQFLEKELV